MEKKITMATIRAFCKKNWETAFVKYVTRYNSYTEQYDDIQDDWQPVLISMDCRLPIVAECRYGGRIIETIYKNPRNVKAYNDGVYRGFEIRDVQGTYIIAAKIDYSNIDLKRNGDVLVDGEKRGHWYRWDVWAVRGRDNVDKKQVAQYMYGVSLDNGYTDTHAAFGRIDLKKVVKCQLTKDLN